MRKIINFIKKFFNYEKNEKLYYIEWNKRWTGAVQETFNIVLAKSKINALKILVTKHGSDFYGRGPNLSNVRLATKEDLKENQLPILKDG